MWNMEVTISVPMARDRGHLADIAGTLVEALEESAGDTGPVVAGRYRAENSVLEVGMDSPSSDPSSAVSDTLSLINRVAQEVGVSLGTVQTVSMNIIADDAGLAPELASV